MGLVEYKKIVVPVGGENGLLKYCIGHKLGDRDATLKSHQGRLVVFDTVEEAQAYIDEEE